MHAVVPSSAFSPSLLALARAFRALPGGAPGGDRTPDLQLRRLPLYPTELLALDSHAIWSSYSKNGSAWRAIKRPLGRAAFQRHNCARQLHRAQGLLRRQRRLLPTAPDDWNESQESRSEQCNRARFRNSRCTHGKPVVVLANRVRPRQRRNRSGELKHAVAFSPVKRVTGLRKRRRRSAPITCALRIDRERLVEIELGGVVAAEARDTEEEIVNRGRKRQRVCASGGSTNQLDEIVSRGSLAAKCERCAGLPPRRDGSDAVYLGAASDLAGVRHGRRAKHAGRSPGRRTRRRSRPAGPVDLGLRT